MWWRSRVEWTGPPTVSLARCVRRFLASFVHVLNVIPHLSARPCLRSSLVAKLVHMEFPQNSIACIGLSAALPKSQLEIARQVVANIGIPLREVATKEGEVAEYVANSGSSCFYCKSQLYGTLQGVADEFLQEANTVGEVVMHNGTNADDRRDPTRLGLVAAVRTRTLPTVPAHPHA